MRTFSHPMSWVALMGATLCLIGLRPQPAAAVDREHQQIFADIRMLQEQSQQLQSLLGGLADALKAVSAKLDDQTNVTRKAFADQKVLVETISGDIKIVREKADETNVRLLSLSQDVEALRLAVPPAAAPATTDAAPTSDSPAPVPSAPLAPGMSPDRLFDTAYADYQAGQFSLAVQGFDTYLRAFPKGVRADEAQFYIGESYNLDSKYSEAVEAYDRVIRNYPSGKMVGLAYYKRGTAYEKLGQADNARQSFETVVKQFPESSATGLAKQALDRLNRPAAR